MTTPRPRPGFTLLEMLLAAAIAALLMAALYVGMDVQIRYAQAGREGVDHSTLARAILARVNADLAGCLTPITATAASPSSMSAAASSSTTTGTTVTTGTAGAATTAGTTTSLNAVTPFNGGLQGDNAQVTVWVSRVPKPPPDVAANDPSATMQQLGYSDVRRVTYWIASNGGLARQEIDRVTDNNNEDTQLPPGVPNEDQLVIAPEVTDLTIRYFDGAAWQDTWDGTQPGADGVTPIGPPRAVEITLGIRKPGAGADDPAGVEQFRHVVAVAAANAQPTATTGTTGTTTGTGSTTGVTP
jgi:prepilin-type N-terminal cleavage/methylation domain-containing protein